MLTVKQVSKRYGTQIVLHKADLEVGSEIKALIGINGSGKSTLLKIAAGIVEPDEGQVFVNERNITYLPPELRNVGYVPQHPALFQHLTVEDNVRYAMRNGKGTTESCERVIHMMGLEEVLHKKPRQLSGGYQSRVSLARALVPEPDVLLMDEPLSGIDVVVKERILPDFRKVLKELEVPVLYVTHDPKEAELLADSFAIIDNGEVQSVKSSAESFELIRSSIIRAYE
jgi:molybdate transport system ATP-binding protein